MTILFRSLHFSLTAVAAGLCFSPPLSAETWPGFRGATGDGISSESNLPVEWSESKNIRWKTDLPGRGNSSPAVTKDRVYLTAKTEDEGLHVISINRADGKIVWQKQIGAGGLAAEGPRNLWAPEHNSATPTPSADENHVWAFFGSGHLVCFDRDGNEKWARNLADDYGAYDITFGMGSSPRFWNGKLYVACMTKGPAYLLALDPATGKEIWKVDRRYDVPDDHPDSYSTPAIWQQNGAAQLLIGGSAHLDAHDPDTGKRLWQAGGFIIKSPYGRINASPAVSDDGAFIVQSSANPGGGGLGRAIAFRTGGSGDVSDSHRAWVIEKKSPDSSTPVCIGGLAYFFRDSGVGYCVDLKTGEVQWEERLARKPVYPAVVAGDGKIYMLASQGLCTVLEEGRQFKKLAANSLPGKFNATPAISDGTIYLRSFDTLWAVGSD